MSSTYVRLARLCVRLSARTENDLDGEDKDADSDEYESHRQDLFEALGDCCCVIGNQAVLEAIAEELKVAAAPEHATNDGIESCLFALRGVADYVGHSDNNVIEPALQLTCTLPQDWRTAPSFVVSVRGPPLTVLRGGTGRRAGLSLDAVAATSRSCLSVRRLGVEPGASLAVRYMLIVKPAR